MPLPATNRLPLRFERDRLTREGRSFHTRHFTLVTAPTLSVMPNVVEESSSTKSSLRVSVPRTEAFSLHKNVIPTEVEESQTITTSVIPAKTGIHQIIPLSAPRFSILLSKKTARLAVDRNLIKRRTSVILTQILSDFPPADYLVIPKRSVLDTSLPELLSDLSSLLPKLK